MAEIKQVSKQKITLNKEKGEYTGEAYASLLGTKPEGYGVATFENGMTLDGRFKEGNFITGTAKLAGIVYQGDFMDLKWLGGTNGRIDYPNDDYIMGAINPISKRLEVKHLKSTQDYDDVVIGAHTVDRFGQKIFYATQTFTNGSKIEGVFEAKYVPQEGINYYNFGISKDRYFCKKGKANIILRNDNNLTASISGEYSSIKDKSFAQINGVYTFTNKNDAISITATGEFTYARKAHEGASHDSVSEDFSGDLANKNALSKYDTNITLLDGGKIKIETPASTFSAVKKITDGTITYQGAMYASDGSFSAEGTFDKNLNILDGKVLIKNGTDAFSAVLSDITAKNNPSSTSYTAQANGTFSQLRDTKEGLFSVSFDVKKDLAKLTEEAYMFTEPTFVSGKMKQYLPTGEVFDGELYSLEQKDAARNGLPQLDKYRADPLYFGTYKYTTDSGEVIFSETGFFEQGYRFICGQTYRKNINDSMLDFTGLYNMEKGYEGKLENPFNGDYQDGLFDTQLNFLSGKMRETYANCAIFEGHTADHKIAIGTLERKDHFHHKGHFEFNEDDYPVLTNGDVFVNFDTADHAFCKARYDREGFELFDGKTYICNFKNDLLPDGVAVADYNITDAFTKFLLYTASQANNHNAVQPQVTLPAADSSTEAQQIVNKYQQEKGQSTEAQAAKNTAYTDFIESAEGIISSLDAKNKPFDMATSQSIMSKVTNPNKPTQQTRNE